MNGTLVEWYWQETKVLVGKPAPVQLGPLHVPHRLTCDWTWAFVVRDQWVSVCCTRYIYVRWENNIRSGPVLISEVVVCIFSEFNLYFIWVLMGREILMRFEIWGSHSSVGDDSSIEGRDAVLLGKYCLTVHSSSTQV
jgi:hypothetical protein